MDLTSWANAIITVAFTCVAAFVTIKILIAEMKKDIEFLKQSLLELDKRRRDDITDIKASINNLMIERKQDIHEIKMDLKEVTKGLTDVRIRLADKTPQQ